MGAATAMRIRTSDEEFRHRLSFGRIYGADPARLKRAFEATAKRLRKPTKSRPYQRTCRLCGAKSAPRPRPRKRPRRPYVCRPCGRTLARLFDVNVLRLEGGVIYGD
jgi:predicted SprT family Zn-dependent metalloprotease